MKKLSLLLIAVLLSLSTYSQLRLRYVKSETQFGIRIGGIESHVFTNGLYVGTEVDATTIKLGGTSLPSLFAPTANGVTNGNTHDHNGGDGGQVSHTSLSSIGTNTHDQIDAAITDEVSKIIIPGTFTAGGTEAVRTLTITFKKSDGNTLTVPRVVSRWWTSTTSYGDPSFPASYGTPTIAVTTGFGTANFTSICTAYSNNAATITITITANNTITPVTFYFMVEIRGQVYVYSSTIFTSHP